MSPPIKLTSEQLTEIIEDEKNTDRGARVVQEQVQDGEEVLDLANTCSVLNTVLSTINNEFEHNVWMRQSGCLILNLFVNQLMTIVQATSIQFQACPKVAFWHAKFRPCGEL